MAAPTDLLSPETAHPDEIRQPRLGTVGWLRWAWRQLTSMRTALLLLLLLAVAAVPGSVFPQRRIDPARVATYLAQHTTVGPWLDRVSAFDVYSSPWFSAIYLLLFVSLVGCVLPRSLAHLRAVRARPPRTPSRLSRMPEHATGTVVGAPQEVLEAAARLLRRRHYRLAEHPSSLSAEKGYLAETGNLAFHLALLGLLGSIAAGAFLGYTGQAIVVEGDTFANTLTRYDSFQAGSRVDTGALAPFSFNLDAMHVSFETAPGAQFGAPREFEADVTVRDSPAAAPRRVTVQVNHPLDVAGTRVFLTGNGYAPVIKVRDGSGAVAFEGAVPFLPQDGNYTSLGVVKVPDGTPRQIALQGLFLPTYQLDPVFGPTSVFPGLVDPRLVLTAYVSAPGADGLGMDSGVPQSVYQVDVTHMTQLTQTDGSPVRLLLAPGTTVSLPGGAGSVTFEGIKRYAALDIHNDPTKPFALVFALLALAGLTTSLFVRRRRLWVRATAQAGGRTVVEVAGLARGEDAGLADEVAAVFGGLVPVPDDVKDAVPGPGAAREEV